MKIVDARGQKCPMPLIRTKKAIGEQDGNEPIKILLGSENSKRNVTSFLSDNHIPFSISEKDGEFEIMINKKTHDISEAEVDSYCDTGMPEHEQFNIVFAKDRIGEGEEELGKMLVQGFLNTFMEMEKIPQKLIFMNSGINLVLNGSPLVTLLTEFEKMGVELLVCGTCLEYYKKMDEVAVGKVSNAYDILNATIANVKILNF